MSWLFCLDSYVLALMSWLLRLGSYVLDLMSWLNAHCSMLDALRYYNQIDIRFRKKINHFL